MNDRARSVLADLLRRYGRQLSSDPRRTEALLRDLCAEDRREISVIVGAIRERVPEDLLGSQDGVPKGIVIARLVKRLEDNLGLAPAAARWAVETWALALGVVSAGDLAKSAEPEPAQATAPRPPSSRRAVGPDRDGNLSPGTVADTARAMHEVQLLLRAGNKVSAVQKYRDALGVGLAEAKRVVDGMEAGLRAQHSAPRAAPDHFGQVVTVAGTGKKGFDDGAGESAHFDKPRGITCGPDGTLYVADTGNRRVRRVAADGRVTTLAGTGRFLDFSNDGSLDQAGFMEPVAVGLDAHDVCYVGENVGPLRVVRLATREVTTLSGIEYETLGGLAVTPDGTLYASSGGVILCVAPIGNGRHNVTKLGVKGNDGRPLDGPVHQAEFFNPTGLALDAAGNLYIADTGNHRIRKLDLNRQVSTLAGATNFFNSGGFADGTGDAVRFQDPRGVAVDPAGRVFVADSGNHRIRRIDRNGTVSTVAGSGQKGYADGPALTARFHTPVDLAFGTDGTLFVLDKGNHCVRALRA